MYGRKAWQQLHQNAASITEQILEATPHKTEAVRPPTNHHENWRSKGELISDIPLWTPSHGRAKAGRPARTYMHQLFADTEYSLEDLPGAMDDRDGWRERVREIHASGAKWLWWWWWWFSYKNIFLHSMNSTFL